MSSLHGCFCQSLASVGLRCPVLRVAKDSRPIVLLAYVRRPSPAASPRCHCYPFPHHPPTIFSVPFIPRCFDHGLVQSTRCRRRKHRAPSPAPSAVHPRSKAYAQGTVTGAVGSTPAIAGVRTGCSHRRRRQCTRNRRRGRMARRHRRRQESLPRHTVSESARSVADCRRTFDSCRSSEGWMWLP